MALFNIGKKKEEEKPACTCNAAAEEVKEEVSGCCCGGQSSDIDGCCCASSGAEVQSIKVLGAGCKSCHEMYENTKEAVKRAGLDVEVEYVTDMEIVMTYGIMSMPGLVINEKVVSAGKVLKAADVEKLLQKL